jgi:hypothetical protein
MPTTPRGELKMLMTTTKFTNTTKYGHISTILRLANLFLATLLVSFSLVSGSASAATSHRQVNFNHSKTGFNLVGAHSKVNCENCHVKGVFKGTPKECSGCHVQGGRVMATSKSSQHVASDEKCEACHKVTGWLPASFNHDKVTPGSCSTCHNNTKQTGKPGKHIQSGDQCDKCHKTTAWIPANGFDHSPESLKGQQCASCHDGKQATGKAPSHVPTSAACDTCHFNKGVTFKGAKQNHTGITSGCSNCHNNVTTKGKSNSHVPTQLSCETCHKSTTTFTGANYTHASSDTNCSNCHNGTVAKGVMSGHVPLGGAQCSACHTSQASFKATQKPSHPALTGSCRDCHGAKFTGVVSNVHNSPRLCSECHNTNTFTGASYKHAATDTNCSTCHTGSPGKGVSANHVPASSAQCSV